MAKNTQSRKWNVTINNPKEKGYTHDKLKELLTSFRSLVYYVMSDEIGLEDHVYHTHFFMYCSSGVRFTTLKNRFEGAHFEMARGTCLENYEYIFKTGKKWENNVKHETNLPETHEEFGNLPIERQGQRNDINDLYDMIKNGLSNFEILEDNPAYMQRIDVIEKVRQIVLEENYKNNWRDVKTTYIWGRTGTGKTRSVMEKFGYENVYRITDYDHPFDGYKNEDVVIFEEFRSSLKVQDMLNYLDGYPLTLPCRYANKMACFTQVYIITNIDYQDQYKSVQSEHPETWLAFCRRIDQIICFNPENQDNKIEGFTEIKDDDMILDFEDDGEQLPFELERN